MQKHLILFSLLLAFGAGCVSDETEMATTEEAAEDDVTASEATEPSDSDWENPLGNHALFVGFSDDGNDFDVNSKTIAEQASVGNLLVLQADAGEFKTGTLLAYFVDASVMTQPGEERLALISSVDNGETWSDRTPLVLEGLPESTLPVDPSVVQLEDGSLRLYFFNFAVVSGAAQKQWNVDEPHVIASAISTDGVTFVYEGESLQRKYVTDPEVVKFGDTWFMYLAGGMGNGIPVATSTDGKTFTDTGVVIDMLGIPGSLVVGDQVSLYGCGTGGITRAVSTDGTTFSEEEVVLQVPACDPDPAMLSDGTLVLLMKGFSTTLNGPNIR